MNRMKKITITAGLALALTVGLGTTAKSAWAGYLTAPTLSTSSGAFQFNINGSGTYYATGNSGYGNTIPTASALSALSGISNISSIADGINNTNANVPTFYNVPAGLDTTPVATMTNPYTLSGAGATVTGDVISNVFKFGANPGITGALPGELVFTYQFDVTGVASSNLPPDVYAATITTFNNPNGTTFKLGSGINTTAIGPNFAGDTYVNGSGKTVALTQALINAGNLSGNVTYAANGSISSLGYNTNSDVLLGEYSPQFFVASNAYYASMGSISLDGQGAGGLPVAVFVPGTPEPKTLILFGSGIALLAFMFRRKEENTLSI